MSKSNEALIVHRLIEAPRDRVFEAFSKTELLTQWFTPSANNSVEVIDFDFVSGGSYRLRYSMSEDCHPTVGGLYERIDSPMQIVMSWIWEAPDPLADISMRVSFDLFEKGEATEVVITHEKISSDQACTVHEDGWEGTLNSLERYFDLDAGVKIKD